MTSNHIKFIKKNSCNGTSNINLNSFSKCKLEVDKCMIINFIISSYNNDCATSVCV